MILQRMPSGKPWRFFACCTSEIEGPGVRTLGKNVGVMKLRFPINQLDNSIRQQYCNNNPSRFSNGHIEKSATLLIHEIMAMSFVSFVEYRSVIGNSGTKMVFS